MSNHKLRTLSSGPCRPKLMQALQAGLTMSSLSSLSSDEESRIELEGARTELEAARKEMKNAIADEVAALLPSDDDGLVELPSDDCDDGGASRSQAKAAPPSAKAARHPHRAKAPSFRSPPNPNARKRQRIPDQMRKWLGEPRGDHPRDVIPGPSAGDSLAAMNIDLPEEVANDELDDLLEDVTTDELDDLFVDVATASPKKEDHSWAKTLGKKRNTLMCSLGPPLQKSRPQWCASVPLMSRLTWSAPPLMAPYRMMSWRCSRPPGF